CSQALAIMNFSSSTPGPFGAALGAVFRCAAGAFAGAAALPVVLPAREADLADADFPAIVLLGTAFFDAAFFGTARFDAAFFDGRFAATFFAAAFFVTAFFAATLARADGFAARLVALADFFLGGLICFCLRLVPAAAPCAAPAGVL